ncbi:MAG: hypothetical protein IIB81_02820 [Nanoarchaeota archaeon]|nr:hypothetical protein [Nanoarchaeota archaeon]
MYCIITNGEKGIQKVNKARGTMIAMRKIEQKEAAKVALPEKKKKGGGKNGFFSKLFQKKENAVKPSEDFIKDKEQKGLQEEREKLGESEKGAVEEHDLEKSLKELGEIFEKGKEKKKHGIIHRLIKREKKAEHPEEAKAEIELKRKLAGKSRAFIKCHKLLSIADKALQNNDILKAKKLYLKTRNMYIKLEYLEKKEIYNELTALYNKLSKGRK